MESHTFLDKLKAKKTVVTGAKVLGVIAGVLLLGSQGPNLFRKVSAFIHSPQGKPVRELVSTYQGAFERVQDKVDALSKSEQENEQLRLENANLRLQTETLVFDCRSRDSSAHTQGTELKLSQETGAKVGRTLAGMYYRPPTHLLPPQLYTLGASYFKAREDEKAAVIFTFLTGLEDNNAYKTSKNFLTTGVAWYRLGNYELASAYFERALATNENGENGQYFAQARLWMSLTAEKTGKHGKAQEWMRQLVDYHPHSTEAAWVNTNEVRRAPSSQEADHDQD